MRAIVTALVALPLLVSPPLLARSRKSSGSKSSSKSGPVCKKGKPCGNSCIAKSATCHQAPGTAKAADEQAKDAESK